MEQWILLENLVHDRSRFAKLTELYIDYTPDKEKILFLKSRTGWLENQLTATEKLSWHIVKDTNCKLIYLISGDVTLFTLGLGGKSGFMNGIKLIKQYGSILYSNTELHAEGYYLNESLFDSLPVFHKILGYNSYWLASRHQEYDENVDLHYYDFCYINSNNVNTRMLSCSSGSEFQYSLPLRPVVKLSKNTMIKIGDNYFDGSTPERGLQIVLK